MTEMFTIKRFENFEVRFIMLHRNSFVRNSFLNFALLYIIPPWKYGIIPCQANTIKYYTIHVIYCNIWRIYEEPSPAFVRCICSLRVLKLNAFTCPYSAINAINGPPLIQWHWIGFAQPDSNKEKHMMNVPIKTVTNIYQYITWGIRDLSYWVLNYVICFESFFYKEDCNNFKND